jgi:hypothetical protein
VAEGGGVCGGKGMAQVCAGRFVCGGGKLGQTPDQTEMVSSDFCEIGEKNECALCDPETESVGVGRAGGRGVQKTGIRGVRGQPS